jgi:hypothetical protein
MFISGSLLVLVLLTGALMVFYLASFCLSLLVVFYVVVGDILGVHKDKNENKNENKDKPKHEL